LKLDVSLIWPDENDSFVAAPPASLREYLPVFTDATHRRRIACEVHKTELVPFSVLLPCISHRTRRLGRAGGPIRRATAGSGR
jgi:hypothetical protein